MFEGIGGLVLMWAGVGLGLVMMTLVWRQLVRRESGVMDRSRAPGAAWLTERGTAGDHPSFDIPAEDAAESVSGRAAPATRRAGPAEGASQALPEPLQASAENEPVRRGSVVPIEDAADDISVFAPVTVTVESEGSASLSVVFEPETDDRYEVVELVRMPGRASLPDRLASRWLGSSATRSGAILKAEATRQSYRLSDAVLPRWFYIRDTVTGRVVWTIQVIGVQSEMINPTSMGQDA